MADGDIRLKLSADEERRLRAMADAAGRAVDDYATELVTDRLHEDRFAEAHAALDEYDRTGVGYDAETEMAEFVRHVAARSKKA